MHRLLVPAGLMAQETVTLPPDAARHLKVLRPRPGEEIELFDGQGHSRRYRWADGTLCVANGLVTYPPPPIRLRDERQPLGLDD